MKRIVLLAVMLVSLMPAMAQTYKVGDFYPDPSVSLEDQAAVAKIEGVVFSVSEDGKHGSIFSMKEGKGLKWSVLGGPDYTDDKENGQANFEAIKALEPDFYGYPAFVWCASLGEGWYIPAINELMVMRNAWGMTQAQRRALNKKIEQAGGDPLRQSVYVESRGQNMSVVYYSSTELAEKQNKIYSLSFNSNSGPADGLKKLSDSAENLLYRAVKRF